MFRFLKGKSAANGATQNPDRFAALAARVNAAAAPGAGAAGAAAVMDRAAAAATKQSMHNFLNNAFRTSEHKNVRNAYTAFRETYPHKNAVNAISNQIKNNNTQKLLYALRSGQVLIPHDQKVLANRWAATSKNLAARVSRKQRSTRRNRSK